MAKPFAFEVGEVVQAQPQAGIANVAWVKILKRKRSLWGRNLYFIRCGYWATWRGEHALWRAEIDR